MAQYCSVSRVPSVVGVVSGRVVHLHGQIRDVRTIIQFLEKILPSEIVQTVKVIFVIIFSKLFSPIHVMSMYTLMHYMYGHLHVL